jgi:hypothetical protein
MRPALRHGQHGRCRQFVGEGLDPVPGPSAGVGEPAGGVQVVTTVADLVLRQYAGQTVAGDPRQRCDLVVEHAGGEPARVIVNACG